VSALLPSGQAPARRCSHPCQSCPDAAAGRAFIGAAVGGAAIGPRPISTTGAALIAAGLIAVLIAGHLPLAILVAVLVAFVGVLLTVALLLPPAELTGHLLAH
jgi:hypothetical protein